MTGKVASTLLGVVILAACGGSQPSAQSPGAVASTLGGPCTSDAQCQAGLTCDKGDPGGQCFKKCTTDAECGAGALCVDAKTCYRRCQTNADCGRAGYVCGGPAPNKFCDAEGEGEEGEENERGEHR
jgi:hypothetical protein